MAEGESPTVARRRVRLALREAREAAGFTQVQVAKQMEWSLSKVIRIETGDVTITPNDTRMVLSYLGVTDRRTVASLLNDARIARSRQRIAWHQQNRFRFNLSEPLRLLVEYEAEAVAVRYYSALFIPAPLQTPNYADALSQPIMSHASEETKQVVLESQKNRLETLLSRGPAVDIFVLLDEAVLQRPIGGAETFAGQLRELLRLAIERTIRIRMIPLSNDAPITAEASFDLISLDLEDASQMVLYNQYGIGDQITEEVEPTSLHLDCFNLGWASALDGESTIDFLRRRAEFLEGLKRYRQRAEQ
jgi:transcriptional regulator with XRE-family HTH domain